MSLIEKITWHAVLDLGSSVSSIFKSYVIILIYHLLKSVILTRNLLIALSLIPRVELIMFLLNYT
jgi:hypothetical protein